MSRFNLRRGPSINYYEPEEPNLDEYVFCDYCGDYVIEYCSIHGPLLVIPDDKISSKPGFPAYVPSAALTIPQVFLHLAPSIIPDAGLGVFTTLTLPRGVRFGPYRGLRTDEINSKYCWQIHDGNSKRSHVVDAGDVNNSNWMRYVNCSRHSAEQNLVAYQFRGQLYYRTIRTIPRFTELLIFYGSEFANVLNINLSLYNSAPYYQHIIAQNIYNASANANLIRPIEEYTSSKQNYSNENYTDLADSRNPEILITASNAIKDINAIPHSPNNTHTNDFNRVNNFELEEIENFQFIDDEEPTNLLNERYVENGFKENQIPDNKLTDDVSPINVTYNHETECFKIDFLQDPEVNSTNANSQSTNIEKKMHQWPDCEFTSNYRKSIVRHRNVHTRIYKCVSCDRNFQTQTQLRLHKQIHNGNDSHNCPECEFTSTCRKNIQRHRRNFHKIIYECVDCDHSFQTHEQLRLHKYTHIGNMPYSCQLCPYKTDQRSKIRDHNLRHTKEIIFSCDLCSYKGYVKRDLNRHLLKCHFKNKTVG